MVSDIIYPILVVDDAPAARHLLEATLTREGYTVVTAESGQEALAMLETTYFPMVITDGLMEDSSGLELCQSIRSRQYPGYIFIVILTALDTKADLIAGLSAGADEYLTKPFHPAELLARLNTGKRILHLERSLVNAYEKIRRLSVTDPLTSAYNRAYANTRLPEEVARAKRYDRPLSVVMCDIDDFKRLNDAYGHKTGDLVLEHFADALQQTMRPQIDWLVRYGGEEFIIVLPETGIAGAVSMAQRARLAVCQTPLRVGDHSLTISASFGVTSLRGADDADATADRLVDTADQLMYKAKAGGKNKVVSDNEAGSASESPSAQGV